jgi:hypothetical protein
MIYTNKSGYPSSVNDTMDSAVRISIIQLSNDGEVPLLSNYEKNGLLVRCPEDAPANNPKNCTRDQLIMLIAAFSHVDNRPVCKRVLLSTIKRLLFAQNTERDKPGSTKYPWPHSFWKDSEPNTVREYKYFDCADIMGPQHVGGLIIAARYYLLYPLLPICVLFVLIELLFPSKDLDKEQNQLIALASIYGKWAIRLYVNRNKVYEVQLARYWKARNEFEYAYMLNMYINRRLCTK